MPKRNNVTSLTGSMSISIKLKDYKVHKVGSISECAHQQIDVFISTLVLKMHEINN